MPATFSAGARAALLGACVTWLYVDLRPGELYGLPAGAAEGACQPGARAQADGDACILPDPGREPAEAGAGRLRPDSLGGEWKVLDVTGVPIVEEDALTGAPRRPPPATYCQAPRRRCPACGHALCLAILRNTPCQLLLPSVFIGRTAPEHPFHGVSVYCRPVQTIRYTHVCRHALRRAAAAAGVLQPRDAAALAPRRPRAQRGRPGAVAAGRRRARAAHGARRQPRRGRRRTGGPPSRPCMDSEPCMPRPCVPIHARSAQHARGCVNVALLVSSGAGSQLACLPARQEGVDLQHAGRGLVVALSWLVRDGTLIGAPVPEAAVWHQAPQRLQGRACAGTRAEQNRDNAWGRAGVEREYDACGELLEVRSRTAVRGGWVGGRM